MDVGRAAVDGWLATAARVCVMSPISIWMQVAIVVFVLIGMVVAIVKLA
jgi:hypothetical protein